MKLKELFDVEICKNHIPLSFAKDNPGTVPYVTTTAYNNGIECYVDYPAQYTGGKITVSKDGDSADAFVQFVPFCGNEKVMVLTPKKRLTDKELLFYSLLINRNKYKFGYGRKCSVTRLKEIELMDLCDLPHWLYNIEIKPIRTEINKSMSVFKEEDWKEYKLGELFELKKGKRLTKADMFLGQINYIGAISENNGVREKIDTETTWDPNCITVNYNGSVGEAFYQIEPFWASDDVNVLYAKDFWKLNQYIAMFIITVIKANKYRFGYGRKWTLEKMKDTMIKLPNKKDGMPDFEYMERYIKTLPYSDRI